MKVFRSVEFICLIYYESPLLLDGDMVSIHLSTGFHVWAMTGQSVVGWVHLHQN